VLVDLDDFKEVNDTLGHGAGDAVLAAIGRRLRASVRGRDTVARLGGDEFAVLMSEASGPQAAINLAERLLETIGEPVTLGDIEARVGASVGIALAGPSVRDAETLMRNADLALYRAKDTAVRRIELYDEALHQESVRSMAIRAGIAGAAERGELRLEYQPIVDLSTGRPVAVEALLRWDHPELGTLLPGELITRAEACGSLPMIGAWVLDRACRDALDWRTSAGPLRVNLDLAVGQARDERLEGWSATRSHGTGSRPHAWCSR